MTSADSPRIIEAGDSAVVLELGEPGPLFDAGAIQPDVNRRAIAIAQQVRDRRIPGVHDVVPTFRSVAVFFDPLMTDVDGLGEALKAPARVEMSEASANTHEIPVVYGGDAGPDLEDVAAFAGCSSAAVVERHVAGTYRVFMLGFLPGFPYMAPVDASIAALRRATPRIRVPAGSVGIAGRQTGIYPRESPGGWQIIGRTAVELFDQDRDPPALMAPGDVVRFTPVQSDRGAKLPPSRAQRASTSLAEAFGGGGTRFAPQENGASITIVQPGLLTTIQDRGRWGYQNLGVPVSGAMDLFAHRLANALVDNPADAATLEVTVLGPELRFEQSTRIAVTGASLSPTVNGALVRMDTAFKCGAGDVLRFGARQTGARAYVAVDGGIAVTAVLGSRATHLRSGMGGVDGRVLRAGDRLSIGSSVRGANPVGSRGEPDGGVPAAHARWGAVARPTAYRIPAGGARLRVLPGPQARFFDASVFTLLERTRFAVSPHSDRMGYRLTGTPIPIRLAGEMISEATFVGALQVPPSGEPILLMADRQTTGGYPQLAVVITADLPLAAQLAPGDWVEFEMCSRPDAVAALKEQERRLRALD